MSMKKGKGYCATTSSLFAIVGDSSALTDAPSSITSTSKFARVDRRSGLRRRGVVGARWNAVVVARHRSQAATIFLRAAIRA